MNRSFLKIFSLVLSIVTILLVAIEWTINKQIEFSHFIGWLFVAIFIAALIGIISGNSDNTH